MAKELQKYSRSLITVEEMEFGPLTLNDFVEIEKVTGVDVTKEMMRAKNPAEMFSSALIREILFRSLRRAGYDAITTEQAGDLSLKGEDLGRILSYALNGTEPEAGGSGNAESSNS
ncbi:MAG: hypothetical protein WC565_09565 [Parcubacteria group bacterium]|jgi:hypothetical protein